MTPIERSMNFLVATMIAAVTALTPIHEDFRWCLVLVKEPILRSMRQFAEEELIIPEGKYEGARFRVGPQPFVGLLLDELESRQWNRFAITGCVQGGKSLFGFVLPAMYHLFERCENTILGVPTVDEIGRDKWRNEIEPAIRASRYASLLPSSGVGSRGGWGTEIRFKNGAQLKFMSGKGGDEKRSSYTSRVVIATEVDKMDTAGEVSNEADPITQMTNRSGSWDRPERRLFLECTVSVEEGRIWQEYTKGTASRIACPCPHCGEYVTPERSDLKGWQAADNEIEAEKLSYFACPECEERITDEERRQMNLAAKLVHRGQVIDTEGVITGDPPPTRTLGFRWNAFNNMFWSTGSIGVAEWHGARSVDEDSAEKELLQFYWAWPWDPPEVDLAPLDPEKVKRRTDRLARGELPKDAVRLTVGVDLGKWLGHWIVLAWRSNDKAHVVDYGVIEIDSDRLPADKATLVALREFRDSTISPGWPRPNNTPLVPELSWYDSGWAESQRAVYAFCRESGDRFRPTKGSSMLQQKDRTYTQPKAKTNTIRFIGEEYHEVKIQADKITLVHVNADYWKSRVHQRLMIPTDSPGSMTIFHYLETPNEHQKFVKHLTAEKQVKRFIPGKGDVVVWESIRRANHWLDAIVLATAANHRCGGLSIPVTEAGGSGGESWFAQQKRKTVRGGRK